MHALIFASLLFASPELDAAAQAAPIASFEAAQTPPADNKAEYEKRKKEAGEDVDKLWQLFDWCEAYGMKLESRSTLRAVLKAEPSNKKAHELLGHVEFEGKWYDSEKKLEEYKKKQLEAKAKETGKVIYKGELVDPADVPYLEKGMTKDASGQWVDTETQKKLAEGWVKQDAVWIPPAEAENIAKGLWKCGDQWLSLEDANKFHSEVAKWWMLPSERVVVYSTCPRKIAEEALEHCQLAYADVARAFGKRPAHAVPVIVLSSVDQYSAFANGDAGITPVEAAGYSSVHGAFLAEALAQFASTGQTLPGVTYWDGSSDAGNIWGRIFTRHAAAQAYVEAIDPSPKAVAKLIKGEAGQTFGDTFWKEKQIPMWLHYGAAAYTERYRVNPTVAAGGNPNEMREWAVTELTKKGGLDSFDQIFKFEIGPDNQNSAKLITQAGLLVAFALDGECPDVKTKLVALQGALKNNKDIPKAAQALADEIKKNEAKLRIFAKM